MSDTLDIVAQNVLWNRLVSVCEEQANALMRAAFGAIVREAGDLSAGVFDANGDMLAQAVTGTPGHVNTMAASVRAMLYFVPADSLKPGDVLVTNDPWLGAGHVFDFVVVTPAFLDGEIVGYLASTSHIVDIGGRGWSAEAASVFEEGVIFPVMHLRRGKTLNEDFLAIVTSNSRIPHEARGDILSLLSCNDTGVTRLLDLMGEYGLTDLNAVSEFIFERSAAGTRKALARAPQGVYENTMTLDGYDAPIELKARMTISDGSIAVDLSGSSPAVERGINCPLNYSAAYASFGIRALLTPEIPNNQASLDAITITAEPGLVVSAERPSPVSARHVIGQALPDLMLGCLEQALPGEVLAESAGCALDVVAFGRGEDTLHLIERRTWRNGRSPGNRWSVHDSFPIWRRAPFPSKQQRWDLPSSITPRNSSVTVAGQGSTVGGWVNKLKLAPASMKTCSCPLLLSNGLRQAPKDARTVNAAQMVKFRLPMARGSLIKGCIAFRLASASF